MDNTSYRKGHFPPQKLPKRKKTKKWFEDCIEAGEKLSFVTDSRVRQSHQNKQANYDLANDKLDVSDVKRVTNPYNIEGLTIPAKMQNYPVALPKIDLLVGEEMKRRFDWRVRVVNEDAVTQKEKDIQKLVNETLVNVVTEGVQDKQEFEQRMKRLNKFKNYEYQDVRERRATQLLKYLWKKEDLENKFSRSFMDLLISSEEIMCVDIIAGEPVVRKVNPLELNVISNGDSPYVEDADIIIEDGYYPPGKVIDMYHDELTDKEVTRIMDGDLSDSGDSNFSLGERERSIIPTGEFEIIMDPETGILEESGHSQGNRSYRGAFDLDGNVRIMRVVWRGVKKIGKVKYFDPTTQSIEEDLVPEGYKPSEGEKVKWIWINEWNEGTMIGSGKDSIKVKYGPRPIQFRSMDNPSQCHSGYIGTYMNINDSRAYSLLDRMKPYQYLYNVYMYRTEQAFAKSYGKILKLPLHLVPDDWDLDQWLNYLFQMNVMVTDAFKEGDKGASQGKLAGAMPDGNMVADLEMGNYIQQHLMMLQYIKKELGEIAGVTEQRQGQIEQRELVGNVQRAVTQSAHITEKWFKVHDNFKKRVLTMLLETAKFAYKGKTLKRQMILDDMTNVLFDIPGDEIMEADYGLFVSNSSADTELFENLKMLTQAAMQNDKMTIADVIEVYTSDSISSIKRKIELSEEEKLQREQDQFNKQLEVQQQQIQAQQQNEQAKRDLEERNNVRDNQTKLLIEEMSTRAQLMMSEGDGGENNKLALDLKKHVDQMKAKEKEIEIRAKDSSKQLELDELKQKNAMKIHNDKMKREDKKITKMGLNKTTK